MPLESFAEPAPRSRAEEERYIEAIDTRRYWLESGEAVTITSKEFHPQTQHESAHQRNVLFLPGWAMGADSQVVDRLGEAFAAASHATAFSISTEIDKIEDGQEALYKEAQAIALYIKERGLTDVVLVGHSQGGDKGIDLATILQQDPEISLRGLTLIDAVGLYDQEPGELARNFAKDSLVNTTSTMVKKLPQNPAMAAQGMRAGASIVAGIFKDLVQHGSDFASRTEREVAAMAKKNPRMEEVTVPVIFIAGKHDPVMDLDRLLPANEEKRLVEEWEAAHAGEAEVPSFNALEATLKDLFPESPSVRAVTAEKLGHHGLPLFRPESVANVTLFLLKRYERSKKQQEQERVE